MVQDTQLTSAWRSPSNIAIIKYWGKHDNQIPYNPSLSITLSKAHTEARMTARQIAGGASAGVTFHFEGKENPAFNKRVTDYIRQIRAYVPFIQEYDLNIESDNSFPHSSGIASSASAMSALALCIAEIQSKISPAANNTNFLQQVSFLARLGSGSASRSLYGPVSLWGKTELVPGSADEFATPLTEVHEVFHTLQDSILIIDDSMKAVSSSTGHALMKGHPFAESRIAQANAHLKTLLPALHSGDITTFGNIAEAEALALHALMMTSNPSFILMLPNTLQVLQRIRAFRSSTDIPVYFTLDAGPNVHVLYPKAYTETVYRWILGELSIFCKDGKIIDDQAGTGPQRVSV